MYNKMKICCECNIEKDLNQFSKNKNIKDGFNNRCKICCSLRNKKRYELKKEDIKVKCNQYYSNNKEIIKSKQIEKPNSYQKNKEWHLNYREKNKEKYLQYIKEYQKTNQPIKYATDPIYKTKKLIGNQIRNFLKGNKNKKTEILLGYSYQEFVEKIGIPKKNEHIDHKIPSSWFIDVTPINIIWNINNLQIVNQQYNQSKLNRFHDDVDLIYLNEVKKYIKEKYQPQIKML
jgi:hypothetical protein